MCRLFQHAPSPPPLPVQFPGCSLPDAAASVRGGVAECWEEERITHEQDGLVVFDGGSYSLGPAAMGEALLAWKGTLGLARAGGWAQGRFWCMRRDVVLPRAACRCSLPASHPLPVIPVSKLSHCCYSNPSTLPPHPPLPTPHPTTPRLPRPAAGGGGGGVRRAGSGGGGSSTGGGSGCSPCCRLNRAAG